LSFLFYSFCCENSGVWIDLNASWEKEKLFDGWFAEDPAVLAKKAGVIIDSIDEESHGPVRHAILCWWLFLYLFYFILIFYYYLFLLLFYFFIFLFHEFY
jgi:hypothetical protein